VAASIRWQKAITPSPPAKSPDNLAEELTDQADASGTSFAAADLDKSGGISEEEWDKYAASTPEAAKTSEFWNDQTMCFNLHICEKGSSGQTSICEPSWLKQSWFNSEVQYEAYKQNRMLVGLPPGQFKAATSTSVHECGIAAEMSEANFILDPDGNGEVEQETLSTISGREPRV